MSWIRRRLKTIAALGGQNTASVPTTSEASPSPAGQRDEFASSLTRIARSRGFDAAEQTIKLREGRLWGRLSMLAEPVDTVRAVDYAERSTASVRDWIAWLQRPSAVPPGTDTDGTASFDEELAALVTDLPDANGDGAKPPLPAPHERLIRTLDWRAKTEGLEAAEQLIAVSQARAWVALSKVAQRNDTALAAEYVRRAYSLDPLPTLARRLQQLLFSRGDIVEAERLFRLSLEANGGALSQYDSDRLGRLQGWKKLFLHGFPLPERRQSPGIERTPHKVVNYLAHSLPHSGAGYDTRSHSLLRALQTTEYSVVASTQVGFPWDRVLMANPDESVAFPLEDVVDGVRYRRLRPVGGGRTQSPPDTYIRTSADEFEALVREERPAIIHAASNFEVGLAAITAARRLGLPVIYEVRGLWEVTRASRDPGVEGSELFETQVRLETAAATSADRVITITHALKNELVRRGVPEGHISVVPNGVDPSLFVVAPRDRELEQQLGLEGKRVIGYVGSFTHYEGLDDLLYAISLLIDQGIDNLHVLLVGSGSAFTRLKTLVAELELSDHVTLTGRVPFDDVHRYYSLIDIAPFPRKSLPVTEMVSPLKPFEAMAMEKAVLVSSVAVLTEIIDDGATGLIFEKGNIDSLAGALSRLVTDPALCAHLGKNAREWVVVNRTWEQAGAAVAEIYRELEDANRGSVPLEAEVTPV